MDRDGNYQDIPIALEGFDGRGLRYRIGNVFRGGRLILDEQPVKRQGRKYIVRDNQGREVQIRLKHNGIDPIPKVEVAGKVFRLAAPLRWYEYGWAGLPLLLVHSGGALGGGFGGVAMYRNIRVFRSDRSTARKYLVTGATTLGAAIAYLAAVGVIVMLVRWYGSGPPQFTEAAWARRTIQDLSLDAPFDFDSETAIARKISRQSQETTQVDSFELYRSRGTPNSFAVLVSRFAYKPGTQHSLDGAVAGGMAKAAGDSNPNYVSNRTTISGLDARSASYQRTDSGRTTHFDLVCAARVQQYWCVEVVYVDDISTADAKRILQSVTIVP